MVVTFEFREVEMSYPFHGSSYIVFAFMGTLTSQISSIE